MRETHIIRTVRDKVVRMNRRGIEASNVGSANVLVTYAGSVNLQRVRDH